MQKEKLIRWAVPAAILVVLYCLPAPSGLKPEAWHMFAIFAATIAGILAAPIASGALMFIGLALTYFTGTLGLGDVLKGFSSGTVWMIFSAYVLSLGFVQSGLGRRIAYKMLSLFGGSSLGVAYSLGIADLIMAPAMPSVTARSGGIILPVAKSINQVLGSQPGPTGKKIGDFLIMTCFQFTPITGSLFLTGMAANPLCASLARDGLGVELSWGSWFYAALVPSLLCFLLMPLLTYKFMNPDLKRTPEAKVMGREELAKMGPMTMQEKLVSVGFVLALLGWGTCLITGYNANAIGLGLVAFLFVTNAVAWKDVLNDKAAWDTVVWFGAIISLAGGLTKLGFITWMSSSFASSLGGLDWVTTFLILAWRTSTSTTSSPRPRVTSPPCTYPSPPSPLPRARPPPWSPSVLRFSPISCGASRNTPAGRVRSTSDRAISSGRASIKSTSASSPSAWPSSSPRACSGGN